MEFRYEQLDLTALILDFIKRVCWLTTKFPNEEKWILVSQIRRAVNSVLLNLAEGSARKSKKDFARFINISLGSLVETHAGLLIGVKMRYIKNEDLAQILPLMEKIWFKLCGLRDSQL